MSGASLTTVLASCAVMSFGIGLQEPRPPQSKNMTAETVHVTRVVRVRDRGAKNGGSTRLAKLERQADGAVAVVLFVDGKQVAQLQLTAKGGTRVELQDARSGSVLAHVERRYAGDEYPIGISVRRHETGTPAAMCGITVAGKPTLKLKNDTETWEVESDGASILLGLRSDEHGGRQAFGIAAAKGSGARMTMYRNGQRRAMFGSNEEGGQYLRFHGAHGEPRIALQQTLTTLQQCQVFDSEGKRKAVMYVLPDGRPGGKMRTPAGRRWQIGTRTR